jgi:hypothetical protein
MSSAAVCAAFDTARGSLPLTEVVLAKDVEVVVVDPVMATIAGDHTGFREPVGLTTIAAGEGEQITSAPQPDPGPIKSPFTASTI